MNPKDVAEDVDIAVSIVTKLEDHEQVPSNPENVPMVTLIDNDATDISMQDIMKKCYKSLCKAGRSRAKKNPGSSNMCSYLRNILLNKKAVPKRNIDTVLRSTKVTVSNSDIKKSETKEQQSSSTVVVEPSSETAKIPSSIIAQDVKPSVSSVSSSGKHNLDTTNDGETFKDENSDIHKQLAQSDIVKLDSQSSEILESTQGTELPLSSLRMTASSEIHVSEVIKVEPSKSTIEASVIPNQDTNTNSKINSNTDIENKVSTDSTTNGEVTLDSSMPDLSSESESTIDPTPVLNTEPVLKTSAESVTRKEELVSQTGDVQNQQATVSTSTRLNTGLKHIYILHKLL